MNKSHSNKDFVHKTFLASKNFEEAFNMGIWGTRIKGAYRSMNKQDGLPHQDMSIGNCLKKYKNLEGFSAKNSKWLEESYDLLCDVTHPNMAGNKFFFDTEEAPDFNRMRIYGRGDNDYSKIMTVKLKAILIFCCGTLNQTNHKLMSRIQQFRGILNLSKVH